MTAPAAAQTTLQLAPERRDQLAELRDTFGYPSLSATLRELIVAFREMHKLPHTIPGLELRRAADGLVLTFAGQNIGLTFERARAIAAALRDYLSDDAKRKTIRMSGPEAHHFMIRGRGPAVLLMVGEVERRLAPDVAEELAGLLEAAAAHPGA